MKLIVNFSNAIRRRFLKSKQLSPYLNQGLSYTDAMRTVRGKPLGINSTSPIVNTLQSRSYMTDPMDLSYVHSNLSKMNRNAPVLAGEVSTVANRLDNNRQVASTVKEAKDNWISTRGYKPSELGIGTAGSTQDSLSQVMLQPERPANRLATGGITSHTHPMLDSAAPSIMDIQAVAPTRLGRNLPLSDMKDFISQKTPLNTQTIGKYDPYYAANAPLDNFIYHQKSPTRSSVVHYPESNVYYNDTGLALKKTSDRLTQNNIIKQNIDEYTNQPIHNLDDSYLKNIGLPRVHLGNVPADVKLKDIGFEPEQYVLTNLGKDNILPNMYMSHPDITQAYANIPQMSTVATDIGQGIQPVLQNLKTKSYKSEQNLAVKGAYNAAKALGVPYSQLGTVNKLTGKKR